jgi:calcineurin-like phosphoesterase family protein
MSEPFFTSDTHYYHENIIRFSNRPFDTIEAMNEALIERWNAKIKKGDLVYHLGDFALKCSPQDANSILDRLNGQIILIRGNHESVAEQVKERFAAVKDYDEITVKDADAPHNGKRKIVLLHYAMRVWNSSHHGAWHLYGHSHGTLPDDPNSLSFDIGVDCWGYAPLSYQEVKAVMAGKSFAPVDHHGV